VVDETESEDDVAEEGASHTTDELGKETAGELSFFDSNDDVGDVTEAPAVSERSLTVPDELAAALLLSVAF
jgi:hypothetical protein